MKKRKPSMRDVAELSNVSISAVSLVVRKKPGVADETRERVWSAIAQLGYVVADNQENGRAPAVGLLIERGGMPALLDIFYGEVVRGFQIEAQRLGYRVLLHMFDSTAEQFGDMYANMCDEVQGFVIANDGDITIEMITQAQAVQRPLVLIESYIPGQPLPCVVGDNFSAGYAVTRHMLDMGHRTLAILPGPAKYSSLTDRLRGCLSALAEVRMLMPAERMPQPQGKSFQRGYMQMRAILRLPERPTAVISISDKTAYGAMEAIKEAGLRIPDDIAIASIDDVSESAYTHPPLTSFHIARTEMGILAMQKLHRLISGELEISVKSLVYGELIVRESSVSQPLSTTLKSSTLLRAEV